MPKPKLKPKVVTKYKPKPNPKPKPRVAPKVVVAPTVDYKITPKATITPPAFDDLSYSANAIPTAIVKATHTVVATKPVVKPAPNAGFTNSPWRKKKGK